MDCPSDPPDPAQADALRAAVRGKYAAVARDPRGQFPYPVGRRGLEGLGYPADWRSTVPGPAADRFVGIGNPLAARRPRRGDRVLDAGCGAGADCFIAAFLVGREGRVTGVDLSAEMLETPRAAAARSEARNLSFVRADLERLPFRDGSFDVVISNGALNLLPGKAAAWRELARVLVPGGRLAVADLVLRGSLPASVLADRDAWSS